MPVAVPSNVKLHQVLLEEWDATVNSGTLDSVVDGPGYTDITCTGATSIDFTRPLRDSQGKARKAGNYFQQLFYCKFFQADIPGVSGVSAITAGIAESDLSTSCRSGPRYDADTDYFSVVVIALGASGVSTISTTALTWAESLASVCLDPEDVVQSQDTCYVRVSDAQVAGYTRTNSAGSFTAPVQNIRVVTVATGTIRVYLGLASIQIEIMDAPRTTYRPLRASDLSLVSGTGTWTDSGVGELSLSGGTGAPIWTFPLPDLGTLGTEEVVMCGGAIDKPSSSRLTVGLEDGTSTPFPVGLQSDGQVYANGVNGGSPTAVTRGAWSEHLSGWHNMGITYGQAWNASGVAQDQRGVTNSLQLTAGTMLGRLQTTAATGVFRAGYWCTGPIALEIVPRG